MTENKWNFATNIENIRLMRELGDLPIGARLRRANEECLARGGTPTNTPGGSPADRWYEAAIGKGGLIYLWAQRWPQSALERGFPADFNWESATCRFAGNGGGAPDADSLRGFSATSQTWEVTDGNTTVLFTE